MNSDPEWFAPKRYGYGAGPPISWQGWLVTVAYAGVMFAALFLLRGRWVQLLGILVPATVAFIVITARTTRGGWRWRWGEED